MSFIANNGLVVAIRKGVGTITSGECFQADGALQRLKDIIASAEIERLAGNGTVEVVFDAIPNAESGWFQTAYSFAVDASTALRGAANSAGELIASIDG